MSKHFRDIMAEIPTCVGVIVVRGSEGLQACTISSLTSLSVELGKEEVLFVLRSGSSTGDALKDCDQFGINILSQSQATVATAAGGSLKGTELHNFLNGVFKSQHPNELTFEKVKAFLSLKLSKIISSESSEIFICRVQTQDSFFCDETTPLIYSSRRFGFVSRKESDLSG